MKTNSCDQQQQTKSNFGPIVCYYCYSNWTINWGATGGGVGVSWWFDDGYSGGTGGTGGISNYSPIVQALYGMLGINLIQADFLENNIDRANELLLYLQTTSTDLETAKVIAKEHIDAMNDNPSYLTLVQTHAQSSLSGVVWWEDATWLNNPNNFNLDIDFDIGTGIPPQELTPAEKALVLLFPVQAAIIRSNMSAAYSFSAATGLANPLNGKQDAFRHAFFQAINTRDVPSRNFPSSMSKQEIVRAFSEAHESQVPAALQLEKTMDLYNNEFGITYYSSCMNCTNVEMSTNILWFLNAGYLKYLTPLDFSLSPRWPTGLNGLISTTELKWTNQ